MNNLKFGVLACGVLGVIAVFLPFVSFGGASMSLWKMRQLDSGQVYIILGSFLAAAVMGGLAAAKPPMLRWQSIVALIGFALVIVKIRDGLPFDFLKAPGGIGMKLIGVSAIAGLITSIVTIVKAEPAK
jgi:hypothetical protein